MNEKITTIHTVIKIRLKMFREKREVNFTNKKCNLLFIILFKKIQ